MSFSGRTPRRGAPTRTRRFLNKAGLASFSALVAIAGAFASPIDELQVEYVDAKFLVDDPGATSAYIIGLNTPPVGLYGGGLHRMAAPGRLENGMLDVHSEEAREYAEYLREEQSVFLDSISNQLGRDIEPIQGMQFQHAFNGMVVTLTTAEALALREHPQVAIVEQNRAMPLDTDTQAFVGAPTIWDGSNTPNGFLSRG